MLRQDAEYLFKIILGIVAVALLCYSVYLATNNKWDAATFFLVAAYAICPFKI